MRSRRPRCSTTTLEAVVITASSKGGWRRWVWTWAGAPPGQGIRWRIAPNTLVHFYEGGRLLPGVTLGAPKAHPIMWPSGSSSPSCRRSPGSRTPARAARHPRTTLHPITRPSGSSTHHGAARHDAAFGHEPPGTLARQCAPLWGRPGAAPIMGPLARTPHSGAGRPALVWEQLPSWGRTPGRRTLAQAARHTRPTAHPIMGPPWSSSHHGAARQ